MAIDQVNHFWNNLPEMNIAIFAHLSFKEALRARQVCTLFNNIFNDIGHLKHQALKLRWVVSMDAPWEGRTEDWKPWSKSLSTIAERGDEEFLGIISNSRWLSNQIQPDELGQMVLKMAEKGHVNCLKLLLNARIAAQIPAEAREKAAQEAGILGHAECARLIIQTVLN